MAVARVMDSLDELQRGNPVIATIGSFDGVHRGHQYLIRQVISRARALQYDAAIVTFDPRPQVVLRPGSKQLSDRTEKTRLIAAMGPDLLVQLAFDRDLSEMPAGNFLLNLLEHLNLAEVWVGADFAFGHDREGTAEFLIRAGQETGFAVHVVPRQPFRGEKLSSSRVRALVEDGDVANAATVLGHYFRLRGAVARGRQRGRELGFPTANLTLSPEQVFPGTGIYAARAVLDGDSRPAAVSVGYNPHFGDQEISVEAYILDFQSDLYERTIALDFVQRIRDEKRFDSVESLVAKIVTDVDKTRRIVAHTVEPGDLLLEPKEVS